MVRFIIITSYTLLLLYLIVKTTQNLKSQKSLKMDTSITDFNIEVPTSSKRSTSMCFGVSKVSTISEKCVNSS